MAEKTALGTFYGVGIGPGDPQLLTRQALGILSSVPVIFVPKAKITDEGLALQILLQALAGGEGAPAMAAELKELVFPMSKDPEVLRPAWDAARAAVLGVLRQGKDCAFITLGDTAIYSTYMNLVAGLQQAEAGLRIVTAAGISSFSQAAAGLNLSLVEKAERMAVLPCLSDVEGMRPDLERFDTVVLMKVGRRFADLRELLRGMGLLPYSHLALKLGTPGGLLTSDLDSVDAAAVSYMSLVIVRKPLKAGYEE
jgi:precorrin-2/cobalt-factor-2 C20-methyltransferase